MRILSQLLFTFCLATSISFEAKAHDPDQISYHFMRYGEGAKLEVHLTPAGAFELIKSLHVDLNDSSIIRLSDYMIDFETYFNETISLNIADKNISFKLENANLIQHDAVLNFDLTNFQGSFNEFNLSISAFTEIYGRAQNHVTVSGLKVLKQFTLDASNQTFTSIQVKTEVEKSGANWAIITLCLLLITAMVFATYHLIKHHNPFRFINQ